VVSGPRATYKGFGTVNGQAGYGFLLSAVDGQVTGGGGTDKFRLKVWEIDGDVVYDTQPGSGEDAVASTAITSGQIVVHKGK